jgi:hypothetical protein
MWLRQSEQQESACDSSDDARLKSLDQRFTIEIAPNKNQLGFPQPIAPRAEFSHIRQHMNALNDYALLMPMKI